MVGKGPSLTLRLGLRALQPASLAASRFGRFSNLLNLLPNFLPVTSLWLLLFAFAAGSFEFGSLGGILSFSPKLLVS